MDLDIIRFAIEISTVAFTAIAAFLAVKFGQNGMKNDVHTTRCDMIELKGALKEASAQRANLNTRLTIVESDVKHIYDSVTRMEKN